MKCETNKRALFLSVCTYLLFVHFKFIKMLFLKAYKYFVQKMNKSFSKSTNFQNVITITTLLVKERPEDILYVFSKGKKTSLKNVVYNLKYIQ